MSKTLIEKTVTKRVKGEARKKVQQKSRIDEKGREILDERPLFHDLGFKQPETMNDKIRRITQQVQSETVAKLAAQNMSEEDVQRILDEEDDFTIPEDYDTTMTQYEARGMLSELQDDVSITFPAEQSDIVAKGIEDTAKQGDALVPPSSKDDNQDA